MLTYEQSLAFIHGIERFGSKPGLRRVAMLLERMGNPQDTLKFIHVAGSDGKGSTCAMLSRIFSGAGYRTGLYISPFVLDFRERIQLDNEMISKEELARSVTTVKAHWDALDAMGETPTEFEVVVAVAMDYFARMKCDLVVLEVGMGGRFDATNIIHTPLCSVITHLSLDHMQYLGDTIEQIAMEKCGIIKPDGVTVCYADQPPEALGVIFERCAEERNPLRIGHRADVLAEDIFGSAMRYGELELYVPLPGRHQVMNAVTAVETARAVVQQGFPLTEEQIKQGIAAVQFPSRVEALSRSPLVLLDGGHNPAEAAALANTLELLNGRRIHAVMGMMADKDVDAVLSVILPKCVSLTTVTPEIPRALSAQELARKAAPYCSDVQAFGSLRDSVAAVAARLRGDDVLLCCGSLYLASSLRPILLEQFGQ